VTNGGAERSLAAVAGRQHGVFTHRDARTAGLTQRQIEHRLGAGLWVIELPGVFRYTATPRSANVVRRAALAWAGNGSVLSHRSAGAIWRLEGVDDSGIPSLTVLGTRHPRCDAIEVHRTLHLPRSSWSERDGLRVTRPPRTIIDLAACLDDESLEIAFDSARRQRLITPHVVAAMLTQLGGRGRPGAARLRRLLAATTGTQPAESVLEVKVARRLREAHFPPPVRQFDVLVFGRRYRLDFAWPELHVALESDGRAFHDFQGDRTRWRHLSASGWLVIPVTWNDVTSDWRRVVGEVTAALTVRGVR
jgi:very-short-patch-repair endonuclease